MTVVAGHAPARGPAAGLAPARLELPAAGGRLPARQGAGPVARRARPRSVRSSRTPAGSAPCAAGPPAIAPGARAPPRSSARCGRRGGRACGRRRDAQRRGLGALRLGGRRGRGRLARRAHRGRLQLVTDEAPAAAAGSTRVVLFAGRGARQRRRRPRTVRHRLARRARPCCPPYDSLGDLVGRGRHPIPGAPGEIAAALARADRARLHAARRPAGVVHHAAALRRRAARAAGRVSRRRAGWSTTGGCGCGSPARTRCCPCCWAAPIRAGSTSERGRGRCCRCWSLACARLVLRRMRTPRPGAVAGARRGARRAGGLPARLLLLAVVLGGDRRHRPAPRRRARSAASGSRSGCPLVVLLPWWPSLISAPGRLLVGPDAALDARRAPLPRSGLLLGPRARPRPAAAVDRRDRLRRGLGASPWSGCCTAPAAPRACCRPGPPPSRPAARRRRSPDSS